MNSGPPPLFALHPGPGENLHDGQLGYGEITVGPSSISLHSDRVSFPFNLLSQTPTQETSFLFSKSVI